MPGWIRRPSGPALLAACLFLLHAAGYLYFFVDDEGITLVYARNLLDGHGLTYARSEGPVEGYSNFLHVFLMAGVLAVVRQAGLDPAWTFVIGGLWALACGVAIVLLTWDTAARLQIPPRSRALACVLLALAGPLAAWSNSSLETVPFALALLALIATTVPTVRRPWAVVVCAVVVCLLRIDGALFAAAWLLPRALVAGPADRRALIGRVAPAVIAAAGAYLAWRMWYFGGSVPLPLQTKVAHKLQPAASYVVWKHDAGYLVPFARQAGLPLLLGLATAGLALTWRNGRRQASWALSFALATLLAYVGLVGDWMFGFRFMVALLAPLALLVGFAVGEVERRRPAVAPWLAAGLVVWAAAGAWRFQAHYRADQGRPLFWAAPSLDPARRFGEYWEIYEALKPRVAPGTVIAYHEAGFVPFMLGVENVDMLGLTTRFVGRLPTRDAIFTDVGRYYPLTDEPPHRAVHAYLVHRRPALVVARKSWMRTANRGRVPGEILGGHYRLAEETRTFTIYERAERPAGDRSDRADRWLENLAHPANLRRVVVNGDDVPVRGAAARLGALWQGPGHEVVADPVWELHLDPGPTAPLHRVYVAGDAPSGDLRIEVTSRAAGRTVRRFDGLARAGQAFRFSWVLDAPLDTDVVDLRFSSTTGEAVRVHLSAVRLLGRTPELVAHLVREGIPLDAQGYIPD